MGGEKGKARVEERVRVCCTNGHSPTWNVLAELASSVQVRTLRARLLCFLYVCCGSTWKGWGGLESDLEVRTVRSCLSSETLASCLEQSQTTSTSI
jgi:hypothetical protein